MSLVVCAGAHPSSRRARSPLQRVLENSARATNYINSSVSDGPRGTRGGTHLSAVAAERRRQYAGIVLRDVIERVLYDFRGGDTPEREQGVRDRLHALSPAELVVRAEKIPFAPVRNLLRVAQGCVEHPDEQVRNCHANHAIVSRCMARDENQSLLSEMCTFAQHVAPSLSTARCLWWSAART